MLQTPPTYIFIQKLLSPSVIIKAGHQAWYVLVITIANLQKRCSLVNWSKATSGRWRVVLYTRILPLHNDQRLTSLCTCKSNGNHGNCSKCLKTMTYGQRSWKEKFFYVILIHDLIITNYYTLFNLEFCSACCSHWFTACLSNICLY